MALKPINYEWLNFSNGFRQDFSWKNGDRVLALLNFTILIGFSGFVAQVFFGIPQLSGAANRNLPLSDYDLTLLYMAVAALLVLWITRLKLFPLGTLFMVGICGLVLFQFFKVLTSQDAFQLHTLMDVILLPITATLGMLIVAVYLWAATQMWRAVN